MCLGKAQKLEGLGASPPEKFGFKPEINSDAA